MSENTHPYLATQACPGCAELRRERDHLQSILDKIEELCVGAPVVNKAGRRGEFETELGKLIAISAFGLGTSLRDLSIRLGYRPDWLTRICRGGLRLTRRSAILLGRELGLDLTRFVPPSRKQQPLLEKVTA